MLEKLIRIAWQHPGYKKEGGRWEPISKLNQLKAEVREYNKKHGAGTHWIDILCDDKLPL